MFTHAFFKAALFLGAGAVIHALSGEQDMRKMGGLLKKTPVTACVMIFAFLAIVGFPGFSGFWSKDLILEKIFMSGTMGQAVYVVGLITAVITAVYMVSLRSSVATAVPRKVKNTSTKLRLSCSSRW